MSSKTCHSFFSRKEMKVFDENIPGFEALRDPEAQMIQNTYVT